MNDKKAMAELTKAFMPQKEDQPSDSAKKLTQAQLLIQLAQDARLFHTPEGQAFAQILIDAHQQTFTIRGPDFRRWLIREFFRDFEKPPNAQALQGAIGVLEARALFDSPEAPLFVRIAQHENRIYIDLCNFELEVIEIGTEGWRVIKDPPVHFRRTKAMRPLPRPEVGGSIAVLRKFINVGDDTNWVLCICWLVAACRARGPYPILIIQGEQGAAKSTMEKILRRVIDPSVALVRTPPKDERDLLIAASNSLVVAYDNLSGIPPWLSDALCRLATGSGFSTRELYTDAEEVFFDAARPIILNGIDQLAERADLADRALILNLPPIEEDSRRDEAELYADFERDLPQILGSLCTVLSCALKQLPHTTLERKPRMADFSLLATAAETGLGFPRGTFMKAYLGNRTETIQETLEGDLVGAAVLALIDNRKEQGDPEEWEGTCKELLHDLEQSVDDGAKKSGRWPKEPRGLSSRLRRLTTLFRSSGIQISFNGKSGKGRRTITINRMGGYSTAPTATSASPDTQIESFQSVSSERGSGGPTAWVADASAYRTEPPPRSLPTNSFNGNNHGAGAAEVAEVAVGSPTILEAQGNDEIADPVEFCTLCGQYQDGLLGDLQVCRECDQKARSLERFEL